MSEQIKYEPISGDQSYFGRNTDTYVVALLITYDDDSKEVQFDTEYPTTLRKNEKIVAMRRIIRTPKLTPDNVDLIRDEFESWWEKDGCLVRSGGGEYEKTFAYAAYLNLMPEMLEHRGLKKAPVWSKADQEAGRLPDVGCFVVSHIGLECKVIGVDDGSNDIAIQFFGGSIDIVNISNIKPIETEAERQQRVRNNWCADANKLIAADKDYRSESAIIYDALLSGELKMPEVQK